MKRQASDWGHIAKELLSKICKELLKLKKKPNLIKIWAKYLNRCLTSEDMQMANKTVKRCFTNVIREMQIKTMRYQYIPTKMAKIQNTDNTNADKDLGHQELSFIVGGN